jgi:hypothetical protein
MLSEKFIFSQTGILNIPFINAMVQQFYKTQASNPEYYKPKEENAVLHSYLSAGFDI